MALLLIIFGSSIGFVAAVFQCFAADAAVLEGVTTYLTFGLGLPVTVGLAKWSEFKLRGLFQSGAMLQIQHIDG